MQKLEKIKTKQNLKAIDKEGNVLTDKEVFTKKLTQRQLDILRRNRVQEFWNTKRFDWVAIGRAPVIKSVEELRTRWLEYQEYCSIREKPLTMSGWAVALDMKRVSLINYGKTDKFSFEISKTKDIIEAELEEDLYSGVTSPVGKIVIAKNNYGWTDKKEVKHSIEGAGALLAKTSEDKSTDHNTILDGEVLPSDPAGLIESSEE